VGEMYDRMKKAAAGPKPPAQPPREDRKPRPAGQRDRAMVKRGRLPDGSCVRAIWIEGRGVWVGELVTDGAVIHHQADGLFRLLEELDTKYRQWLKDNSQPFGVVGGDK
jgi:hypothetical protein